MTIELGSSRLHRGLIKPNRALRHILIPAAELDTFLRDAQRADIASNIGSEAEAIPRRPRERITLFGLGQRVARTEIDVRIFDATNDKNSARTEATLYFGALEQVFLPNGM